MKAIKIDLGEKGPETVAAAEIKSEEPRKYYPTIHITREEKIPFPKHGKMTVTFHKIESSMSERDGKPRYSCTLELREIEELEIEKDEKESAPSYKKTEDALDSIMAEKKKAKETEGY